MGPRFDEAGHGGEMEDPLHALYKEVEPVLAQIEFVEFEQFPATQVSTPSWHTPTPRVAAGPV
jgi:hypothetical protein